MTDPVVDGVAAGTQQIVQDAQRLGLTWNLRPATVNTASPLTVIFDGDTAAVAAVSTIGILTANQRVMGLLIPPGGIFITGVAGSTPTSPLGVTTNISQGGGVGNTTSAAFVNMPGNPTISFVKKYTAAFTHIKVTFSTGSFSSAVNTGISYALQCYGADRQIMDILINVANAHVYFGSTFLLTGIPPGAFSAVGRWRRTTGAGLIQMDNSDWTSITFDEVWAV